MVWHQVSLNDLALFLFGQDVEDGAQLPTGLTEDSLPSPLGHENNENNVVLAVPFRMG